MINNINRKWFFKIKKMGLTLSLSMTCLSCASSFTNVSVGKAVRVSANARTSIISDNSGFEGSLELDYVTKVYTDSDSFFITEYDKDEIMDPIDKNINTSTLKNVYILRLDGSCCGELDFLKHTKNVEYMIIDNFNCLSLDNLKYLSELSNLDTLYIKIPVDFLLKNPTYKLDLEMLKQVENIYLLSDSVTEVSNLLLYNLGKSYYTTSRSNIFAKFMDTDVLEKVKNWDKKFDDMLEKIPISSDMPDDEKLMQIVYFINSYYRYDDEVSEFLDTGEESKEIDDLVTYYNNFHIDPIFNESREGICSNFATLTNILCYKAGLESYYISGYATDINGNDIGHAWNLVNVNDNYYWVDTTTLESNIDYIVFSELECQSEEKNSWYDAVLSEILIELDGSLASFYTDEEGYTDSVVNGDNVVNVDNNITYFNSNNSKYVLDVKYESRFRKELKICTVSSLMSLILARSISREKIKKRELIENEYFNY